VCGTNDYMAITNKTGNLVNATSGNPFLFNNGSTNSFKLAAELKSGAIDWTKLGASSAWRDVAATDAELAAVPSFADYTWEVWTFGAGRAYRSAATLTNTTAPDVTYTQRISSRVPSVGSLKTLPWNTIDANDYLNPTSTASAAQTTVTVAWKSVAEPVDYVNVDGQKNTAGIPATATTAATPASFIRISGDSSSTGVKVSDSSKAVSSAADPAGIASLIGVSGGIPIIPNCSLAQFPVLDSVVGVKDANGTYGTYRDLAIRSRNYSLARKYVVSSWNNFID
jgi:hypothetical protein